MSIRAINWPDERRRELAALGFMGAGRENRKWPLDWARPGGALYLSLAFSLQLKQKINQF